ncbi:InlB B-repeat-containing protein [Bifidobacterium sp. ESL0745]|uniref:InlB B-repeat-containing protein n=1 Tax=Bifidobacterium sp. ESL0745 TaxID=2983226 RepID=UPI0023F85E2C|nr:InlB B-repeat-containing protein [Bifidobacterium sp. ESL0745]
MGSAISTDNGTDGSVPTASLWEDYEGKYTVPAGVSTIRFAIKDVTPSNTPSTTDGGIIDDVSFYETESLTYDANGGTGTVPTQVANGLGACEANQIPGEELTLPTAAHDSDCWDSSMLTRTDATFAGWSLTKHDPFDNQTDAQNNGSIITQTTMPASALTLYAVWVRKPHTVEFKEQGGANGTGSASLISSASVAHNGHVTAPSPPGTYNAGISFKNWGVATDGNTDGEGQMETFTPASDAITDDKTIWPLWGYTDSGTSASCTLGVDTIATCFPDATLAGLIVTKAGATDATAVWTMRDALAIIDLDVSNHIIANLDGLQTLTNLVSLNISSISTGGVTTTPLTNLTKMTALKANNDSITSLANIETLTQLQTLYVSGNGISDISGISSLSQLRSFDVSSNSVSNLTGVGSLTNLKSLNISNNTVSSLSPLSTISGLMALDAEHNAIEDVTPLKTLTGLQTLKLAYNHITDISSLKGLSNLAAGNLTLSNQTKTLTSVIADPGITMQPAKTVNASDPAGSPVASSTSALSPSDNTSVNSTTGVATWNGPLTTPGGNVTQDFSTSVTLGSATATFSGKITQPYTVAQHTVSFDLNSGTVSSPISNPTVYSGYKTSKPTEKPTRSGYFFTGWYTSVNATTGAGVGDAFDFDNTPITAETTLYAGWVPALAAIPLTGTAWQTLAGRFGILIALIALSTAIERLAKRKRFSSNIGNK